MGAKTMTALVTAAALGTVLALASPVLAQQRTAAQIQLTEGDAPYQVQILGPVRAQIHQKSMFPKTPSKQLANEELQKQAAKLGADAVVKVTYENYNAMTSKDGFVATGVAVKYVTAPASTVAAAPAPVAAPPVAAPPQQVAAAPAMPAPTPSFTPIPAPAPAALPPRTGPLQASQVTLSEQGTSFRYTAVRELKAEVHQKSMFPKNSSRELLDMELQKQAAQLGADAVINVRYDINNPMFSKKGQHATGLAIKYQTEAAAVPQQVAAASPAPAYTPAPAIAAPAIAPAVRTGPTPAEAISLSETDIPYQYVRVREVKAEVHQKSMFPKTPSKELLDQDLRRQAARLGADAVINVKYDMNSAMFSKKGQHASGVAVKYVTAEMAAAAAAPQPVQTAATGAAAPPQIVRPAPGVAPNRDAPPPTRDIAVRAPAPPAEARTSLPSVPPPAVLPVGVSRPAREAPAPAAGDAAAPATSAPRQIALSEADITDRRYTTLGEVRAEAHQTAIITSKNARTLLEESLRAQAERLGADAVVQIKYDMTNPVFSNKGSTAVGTAVKFQ